jgi:hypothetical protein
LLKYIAFIVRKYARFYARGGAQLLSVRIVVRIQSDTEPHALLSGRQYFIALPLPWATSVPVLSFAPINDRPGRGLC